MSWVEQIEDERYARTIERRRQLATLDRELDARLAETAKGASPELVAAVDVLLSTVPSRPECGLVELHARGLCGCGEEG